MDQRFLISPAARTLSTGSVTRISYEESHDTFRRIGLSFDSGEPSCWDCGRSKAYAPLADAGIAESVLFGLSQLGVLHFGQTLGFSPFSRGSHSWPHLHRQPSNNTIPICVSSDPLISSSLRLFTVSIYNRSCAVNLLLVYTTSKGDMDCGSGRHSLVNGWGGKSPLAAGSSGKVTSGLSRHSQGAGAIQSPLTRLSHTAPVPTTPRPVNCVNTCLRCSS